ncbi:MAG: hypothetical protein R3F08_07720 [Dokdonella sp.]
MNYIRIVLIIVLIFVLSTTSVVNAGEALLRTTVTPKMVRGNDVALEFEVRFEGTMKYMVDAGSVPGFGGRSAVRVSAERVADLDKASNKPCQQLVEKITIDEVPTHWIEINPGSEFRHNVRLSQLYDGVAENSGQCDLIINWTYKIYTQDAVRFPRVAGSVVVSSDGKVSSPTTAVISGESWTYGK